MEFVPDDDPIWELFGDSNDSINTPIVEDNSFINDNINNHKVIGIISNQPNFTSNIKDIANKLNINLNNVNIINIDDLTSIKDNNYHDIIIIDHFTDIQILSTILSSIHYFIIPGGYIYSYTNHILSLLENSNNEWIQITNNTLNDNNIINIQRRCILVSNKSDNNTMNKDFEYELLEQTTISLSVYERNNSEISNINHIKAVSSLQNYGLCIIRGIFDSKYIQKLGISSISDSNNTFDKLKSQGKDPQKLLPHEYPEGNKTDIIRIHGDKMTIKSGINMQKLSELPEYNKLRYHPSILKILVETALDKKEHSDPSRLNINMLRRSETILEAQNIGAVLSLPGKGKTYDQMIHIDTEHLYEHIHLPPHYLVMFLPTMNSEKELHNKVGQTAFVTKSHILSSAKQYTKYGELQTQYNRYKDGVVRPQCSAGDAIIFDARILHFGIANSSNDITRSILFINYHRPWFQDVQHGNEIIVRLR